MNTPFTSIALPFRTVNRTAANGLPKLLNRLFGFLLQLRYGSSFGLAGLKGREDCTNSLDGSSPSRSPVSGAHALADRILRSGGKGRFPACRWAPIDRCVWLA
jgi:hypothetical protein